MRKLCLLLAGLVFFCGHALAQSKTITGKVTDAKDGSPLSGVSVTVKGGQGTTTKDDGTYTLTIPASVKSIEFSRVGFEPESRAVGAKTAISITMNSSDKALADVVVVGYGTKTVRENTGSISKVSGAKVAEIPLPSFDQALAGKTAGVQINATGGTLGDGVAIRIRGVNSISNSSQPLIVIDGIPQIALTNTNAFNSGDGTRFNPLAMINPNDIESYEVLKDAGSAVIYGSRASNGVILITTKKGKKGTAKVNFEAKFGFANPTKLPSLLTGDEFAGIQNEKAVNRFGASSPNAVIARDSDLDGDGKPDRTNWLDYTFRQGLMSDYSVSFSGGSEKSSFYASARYLSQEGTTYGNKLKQGQGRLNLELTPKKWFKAGTELSYSRSKNYGILTDRFLAGTVTSGWQAPPNVSVRKLNGPAGGYNLTGSTQNPIGVLDWGNNTRTIGGTVLFPFNFYNPIAVVDLNRNINYTDEYRGSIYGEFQPIKGLRFTSKFGVQQIRNQEDQYTNPVIAGLGQPFNGLLQNYDQNWNLWNWQNYVSFDKTIADRHKVSFVGGMDYQKDEFYNIYTGAANFSDPFFQYIIDGAYTNVQPGTTTTLNLTGGDKTSSGLESYFGRLSYSFNGKYFIEGAVRRDSYSGFGTNNKWGTFPSVSAGWEVTKEKFMNNIKWLNYLKIRGSYGEVGNSRGIGPYASRALYGGAVYTISTGLGNTQAGNAGLRWEKSKKTDIGFEAGFLNDKIRFIFDYYKNNISDLVLAAPTLYTVGIPGSSIRTNIGGMYNQGLEFTVNATPISNKEFSWYTSVNFSSVKNKVTGLVPSNNNADIASGLNVARLNESLGIFYLPKWAGVDVATGNPMWYAKDGTIKRYNFGATGAALWTDDKGNPVSSLSTADYVYLTDKQGLPKWYGGWDNTFRYRNIELNISTMFQGGNYLYNSTKAALLANSLTNNLSDIKRRWRNPGDKTDIPRLYLLDNTANQASTRFLEKADFLRVRSISLGYNFSKNILEKIDFESLRVYVSVTNAFTFTGYTGIDPEVNTNRFDNIAVGFDSRNNPQSRIITLGIQAGF